jgi:hypothetical protein
VNPPKLQIQTILKMDVDKLEAMSDKELSALLGPLVPMSRLSNKNLGEDDLVKTINILDKLMKGNK